MNRTTFHGEVARLSTKAQPTTRANIGRSCTSRHVAIFQIRLFSGRHLQPRLGQRIDLATVEAPMFLLAARDDELVAPPQLFAAEHLVGTPAQDVRKEVAPCRHLGLFMGKRTLEDVWPSIVRWIAEPPIVAAEHVEAHMLERIH